jgi:hypothetical protein
MKKRTLTPAQETARDERRQKFRVLWKQVTAMPPEERIKLATQLGIVTCDGHALSAGNSILCMLQIPACSVVGGFKQWLKHGRAVTKGQHGAAIWVPTGCRNDTAPRLDTQTAVPDATGQDRRFVIGYVFDCSQTEEVLVTTNPELVETA